MRSAVIFAGVEVASCRQMRPRPSSPAQSRASRGVSTGPDADALDAAVHQILKKLKQGQSVRLPGLGTLRPGPERSIVLDALQPAAGPRSKDKNAGPQK